MTASSRAFPLFQLEHVLNFGLLLDAEMFLDILDAIGTANAIKSHSKVCVSLPVLIAHQRDF